MLHRLLFLVVTTALLLTGPALMPRALAQVGSDCGVVTEIDYPLDIGDTFARGFDDFARYRRRYGGLHTGIDLAFRRHLEPVRAAANGRVTYADPAGWDTELGVVIIRHNFPDGSVYYSLYGHMEESAEVSFPPVGACVRRGDIVGLVGDPSLSLPHLHYEIRDFMPDDGGPGYVLANPRPQGWYHPLDFTDLWRIRLQPGYVSSVTLDYAPDLPPVVLDSGTIAAVSGPTLSTVRMPETPQWQIVGSGTVAGVVALPGDRLATVNSQGAVSVFANGRYAARWEVDAPAVPPVALGEALIFAGDEGLVAYDAGGDVLWQSDALFESPEQVMSLATNGMTLALTVRANDRYRWLVLDASGRLTFERNMAIQPVYAPGLAGGWLLMDGAQLLRVDGAQARHIASAERAHGRTAALTADPLGNTYVYLGDGDSTLLSFDAAGELRWSQRYPLLGAAIGPLMAAGSGCALVTLDADGVINLFDADTGELARQLVLYAGGDDTARPNARLLSADGRDRLLIGAGFHSIVLLDGVALLASTGAACEG